MFFFTDVKSAFCGWQFLDVFHPVSVFSSLPLRPCPGLPRWRHGPGLGAPVGSGSSRFPPVNAVGLESRLSQKEEYHTQLALLYLDKVLQQRSGTGSEAAEATDTQLKLQHLLQKSDLYRVHLLIGEGRFTGLSSIPVPQQGGKELTKAPVSLLGSTGGSP